MTEHVSVFATVDLVICGCLCPPNVLILSSEIIVFKSFTSIGNSKRDQMSKFKCSDCDRQFKIKRNFVHHTTITCKYNEKIQNEKNPKFKHRCDFCVKRFRTQNLAQRHTKRLHSRTKNPPSTNVSSSPSVAVDVIETPINSTSISVHNIEENTKAGLCSMRYLSRNIAKRHVEKMHSSTENPPSINVSSSPGIAVDATETPKNSSSTSIRSKEDIVRVHPALAPDFVVHEVETTPKSSMPKVRIISDDILPLCTLKRFASTSARSMLQVKTCCELKIGPCCDCQQGQTENHIPCRFQYFRKIRYVRDRTI